MLIAICPNLNLNSPVTSFRFLTLNMGPETAKTKEIEKLSNLI